MHIAFVIFRAEPTRGGAERYVFTLAQALVARGHRVTLLASKLGELGGLAGVKIAARGLMRTARYRSFLQNLDQHLDANRYDIIHAALPVPRCDVYHAHAGLELTSLQESHRIKANVASQAASRLGANLSRKRRAFAVVESKLLGGPTPPVVICLSDRERAAAARLFPSAASRLVTLHSTPNDAIFSADKLPERRARARRSLGVGPTQTMFLFIGQDFQRKGLATAIKALGGLNDTDAVLYVLGDGDLARYSAIAVKCGVVGRVLFAGQVVDVPTFMAAADALVLPSRYEPFGMVAIEAMLMGVPPIVSAVSGASEVVRHGVTGLVVPSANDIAAWTTAMRSILDRKTRDQMSEACLAERGRFSYATHVDAIEAIYQTAIKTRASMVR